MFFWGRVAPQSPEEELTPTAKPGYIRNFRNLNLRISEGNSFSGYERNPFFINLGGKGFANIAGLLGADFDDDGRAVATSDWDHDGDLDLWITNRTSPRIRLLRNNHPEHNESVTIRLIGNGTTTNRDAIGARVSIWPEGRPELRQIRTVRAGEGFLAQSSSWVHFGLGEAEKKLSVQVEWPAGGTETLDGLKAGKRYLINQFKGAKEIRANSPSLEGISIPEIDEVRQEKGLWLADRLPFPELIYSNEKGGRQSTREFSGKPVLVNLWASWCEDCLQEMSEFSENQEKIRGLGATILALNVDGLTTDNQETEALDGWAELSRLGYQLESGKARPENLGKMEILLEFLTSRRQPLSIPTSFLVDSEGEVAAIYQGIVSSKQIISDLALLKARSQDQLSRLSPRPGRWFENPLAQNSKTRLGDYSTLFARNGFPAEAEYLLQLANPSEKATTPQELYNRAKIATAQGKIEEAKELYQAAIRANPEYGQALTGLGALFLTEKRSDLAEPLFEKALEVDPNHAAALINLAMIDQSRGRKESALEKLTRVIELNPDYGAARLNLGSLYASMGEFPNAIVQRKKAILLNPKQPAARLTLAAVYADTKQWERSRDLYLSVAQSHPKLYQSFLGLGSIYERQGQYLDAVTAYQKVITMGGRSARVYTGVARAYLALGQKKEANSALETALKINPNYPAALKILRAQ